MSWAPSKRLTEALSEYLRFPSDALEIGLWSGDLQLKDVEIKEDKLDSDQFTLISGRIGQIHAQIPWTTLLVSTAKIEVS